MDKRCEALTNDKGFLILKLVQLQKQKTKSSRTLEATHDLKA